MPDSLHAVSACLPLWQHNVQYEEGDPEVVQKLQAAYPRFCLHQYVRELCRRTFGVENGGLIFASRSAAKRAKSYVEANGIAGAALVELPNQPATGVSVDPADFGKLKEYWQHAGEIISSRTAESILNGQRVISSETAARQMIRKRLLDLRGGEAHDVWLHPCGMSAIAAVWRAIRKHDATSPSVQFGFPYVDTLKIQQRFGAKAYRFLPTGNQHDLDELKNVLAKESICAVFCEAPTNPLLTTPDLRTLRSLADQYGFVLVIDDTLQACINQDLLPLADVIVTSLTKYFSGHGDVLAGAIELNYSSRHAARLRDALNDGFEEQLTDVDAEVLERNSRDVRERVTTINHNAAILVERFQKHPLVETVFHPSVTSASNPGRDGGLMSIVLKNPSQTTPAVFDALNICKGPNLGTNFTLCCPYTLLAHYTELDFVEQFGVSRWLIRISIGTEPVDELWQRFAAAFDIVR
jgi:cystathionine gamma-synthase